MIRERAANHTLDAAARKQQSLYNAEYNRLPVTFSGFENWRLSYIRREFQALDLQPGERFLDIGVGGTGYTVLAAAQLGAQAVGSDISPVACRTARRYGEQLGVSERTDFLVSSVTELPFADGVFNKVACNAVIEHVENDDLAIDEICRVCAPGARVLICVPNTYLTMAWPLALLNLYNDHKVRHIRHYAASDLVLRFGRRGLRVVDIAYHGHVTKIVQLLLSWAIPMTRKSNSRLWWATDRLDLSFKALPNASNVSVTFEKPL